MATFDIPLGTTQTVSSLSGTNTINGNSTAAYGAGGGTLDVTGDANNSTITVNGGILHLGHDANHATITLNNSSLDMSGGRDLNNGTVNYGTGASSFIASPQMATTRGYSLQLHVWFSLPSTHRKSASRRKCLHRHDFWALWATRHSAT